MLDVAIVAIAIVILLRMMIPAKIQSRFFGNRWRWTDTIVLVIVVLGAGIMWLGHEPHTTTPTYSDFIKQVDAVKTPSALRQ